MANLPPEVQRNEIEFDEDDERALLGEGGFGKVYKGHCREQEVAIKVSKHTRVLEKELKAFWDEVDVMRRAISPRIVLFLGVCTEGEQLMTVSEFVKGKNLQTIIQEMKVDRNKYSMFDKLVMARDIAIGVNWLHCQSPRIIHRDLKPANLLYDERARCVKLCDFGLSSLMEKTSSEMTDRRFRGSPLYMAPEILARVPFNAKIDQYSFALVLYELVTNGQELFPYNFRDLTDFRTRVVREHLRPPLPDRLDRTVRNIITSCWEANPDNRPEWSEVIRALSHTIINMAIRDPAARVFWSRDQTMRETEIPWGSFREKFLAFLEERFDLEQSIDPGLVPHVQITDGATLFNSTLRAFYMLLTKNTASGAEEDDNAVVNIEQFGRILQWMGAVERDNHCVLFSNIAKIVFHPWFHGAKSSSEAARALSGRAANTFLVRFSAQPAMYAVSIIRNGGTVQHQRIEVRGDASIADWIEEQRGNLQLEHACDGSPFLLVDDAGGYVLPEEHPR